MPAGVLGDHSHRERAVAARAKERRGQRRQPRPPCRAGGDELHDAPALGREVEVRHPPLLGLPALVEVHVRGPVLDPAVDELEHVVDADVAHLPELGARYARQPVLNCHLQPPIGTLTPPSGRRARPPPRAAGNGPRPTRAPARSPSRPARAPAGRAGAASR